MGKKGERMESWGGKPWGREDELGMFEAGDGEAGVDTGEGVYVLPYMAKQKHVSCQRDLYNTTK